MQPLNPFLRAFFRSGLPSQCVPAQNHILLVPTTEFLLTSWDRDSNARYSDLVGSDEFLGSHVLRIPANATAEAAAAAAKGAGTTRDGRGKAKQLNTVNGRTVIVKESFVYSNKGFKSLAQAQLLNDVLWYPDQLDAQQWLIYFISRPLIGVAESYSTTLEAFADASHLHTLHASQEPTRSPSESTEPRKDIRTFNELLNSFPMIARQMEPGLQRLFKEFAKAFERPPPSRPSQPDADEHVQAAGSTPVAAADGSVGSDDARTAQRSSPVVTEEDEQASLRQGMESLVTGAIELFQLVDKQQLSLLGTSTTVTGPAVEKLIERYMLEQVHRSILFPRICALNRPEDQDLEAKVRRMENVDVSQVGIAIPGGMEGKREILLRLDRSVEEFRKLGVAGSPHEMVEVLLATEKSLAAAPLGDEASSKKDDDGGGGAVDESEKPFSGLAMNADTLVSLLLVVVIRAQVRYLRAQLAYMHEFIFIDDVEAGETGYALSTLEAVLSYLSRASGGLRTASRKNKRLWEAARHGRVREIKSILAPSDGEDEDDSEDPEPGQGDAVGIRNDMRYGASASNPNGLILANGAVKEASAPVHTPTGSTLGHVFPFFGVDQASTAQATRSKRVSVDIRSMSSSSGRSFRSRSVTLDSRTSGIEGDTSVERLAQTQDQAGDSVLMMGIENRQAEALRFLLGLQQFYPLDVVLKDCNNDGTTLLSAAVQTGDAHTIDVLLDFVMRAADDGTIAAYFARQDARGRTMAHYLFNTHHLIKRIGPLLPWRARDRNGQTPLFALCRSYDHASYHEMVFSALVAAEEAQGDGLALHLDDHVDGKGNTLLHVVNDSQLVRHLLQECDSDVNATNDKRFTPLMVASKYGRIDLVNVFLGDARVDLFAKELRGLTAIELAKDDDVRNRIDDLILLSMPPDAEGRIVAVVRSYFVEDATVRLVVKSAVPSTKSMVTITTSRRSLSDFENLARCLSTEHPASWLPSVSGFRSPFQIPSRPSRAVLRDIQLRLDNFLRILLAHSTFATHEMLWEFFLVPEMLPEMMVERSRAKAAVRAERVRDEYAPVPVADVYDVDLFAQHAKNEVRRVKEANGAVVRSANKLRCAGADVADAQRLCAQAFAGLGVVDGAHATAMAQAAATSAPSDSAPHVLFQQDMRCIATTIAAMQTSLSQPRTTIEAMTRASAAMERHLSTLRRSDRWAVPLGLGLLDGARSKLQHEASRKVDAATAQVAGLGAELRYGQQTVAAELAAWHDLHATIVSRALRSLAQRMLVAERARLDGLKRAVRKVVDLDARG